MAEEEKKEEEQELSQEELAKQWEEALAQQQTGEEAPQEQKEEEAEPQPPPAERKVSEKDVAKILDRLMDIPLNVEVVVGSTVIQIKELINLGPGSVLELDRETTEPVDVKVNGKLIARGELVGSGRGSV